MHYYKKNEPLSFEFIKELRRKERLSLRKENLFKKIMNSRLKDDPSVFSFQITNLSEKDSEDNFTQATSKLYSSTNNLDLTASLHFILTDICTLPSYSKQKRTIAYGDAIKLIINIFLTTKDQKIFLYSSKIIEILSRNYVEVVQYIYDANIIEEIIDRMTLLFQSVEDINVLPQILLNIFKRKSPIPLSSSTTIKAFSLIKNLFLFSFFERVESEHRSTLIQVFFWLCENNCDSNAGLSLIKDIIHFLLRFLTTYNRVKERINFVYAYQVLKATSEKINLFNFNFVQIFIDSFSWVKFNKDTKPEIKEKYPPLIHEEIILNLNIYKTIVVQNSEVISQVATKDVFDVLLALLNFYRLHVKSNVDIPLEILKILQELSMAKKQEIDTLFFSRDVYHLLIHYYSRNEKCLSEIITLLYENLTNQNNETLQVLFEFQIFQKVIEPAVLSSNVELRNMSLEFLIFLKKSIIQRGLAFVNYKEELIKSGMLEVLQKIFLNEKNDMISSKLFQIIEENDSC